MKITSKVFRPLIPHKGTPSWKWGRSLTWIHHLHLLSTDSLIHSKPGGCLLPHVLHHSVFSGISLSENLYPESFPPLTSHLLYSKHGNQVGFSDACLGFLGGIDTTFIIFYDNESKFQNHINIKTENPSWTQIPSSLLSDFPAFSMGNCTTFPYHIFRGQAWSCRVFLM